MTSLVHAEGVKAIAAMSHNRVIGRENQIPWHLPEDFKWFKRCTSGQVVLMGRKTFESLARPLPNRLNLVLSRTAEIPGVEMIRDMESFDESQYAPREVWLIGGAELYSQLLPKCTDLYLSLVKRDVAGDAFFPPFEQLFDLTGVVLQQPEFEVLHYSRRSIEA